MTIDPTEAGAMLDDIEAIARRVKQSSHYRAISLAMIIWGAIVVVANIIAHLAPHRAGPIWVACNALGFAATLVLRARTPGERALFEPRLLAAFGRFVAFGFAWCLLAGLGPRELAAFWPSLFLFGYALAGLWLGPAFTIIGVAIAGLVFAGYLWSGAWYDLYLALVNGGGLILCGAWMRRA